MAIGPSRTNPETGEIIDADIIISSGWINVMNRQANIYGPDAEGPTESDEGDNKNLLNEIDSIQSIPYEEIPNFPVSTVEGHKGQLIFGQLGGKKVVAMQGRFHFYEGYSMSELVFPVRVMKFLGIEKLMVSNASGGVNPSFEIGDIMLISDHINLFPTKLIIYLNKLISHLPPLIYLEPITNE